jgi:hypothetical protein
LRGSSGLRGSEAKIRTQINEKFNDISSAEENK